MDDAAADLRVLTFTISQLRQMLLSHWYRDRPASIEQATLFLKQHLEQEWVLQSAERCADGSTR